MKRTTIVFVAILVFTIFSSWLIILSLQYSMMTAETNVALLTAILYGFERMALVIALLAVVGILMEKKQNGEK